VPATAAVSGRNAASAHGTVRLGGLVWPCALGRGGRRTRKREGDGATPVGCWRIAGVLYRADRVRRPPTRLPLRPIRPDDGWCDAPADRNYNRAVRHPYPASAERLWRADRLYDVVVVLAHNFKPRVRGGGSAIFMHLARPDYASTEGCMALRLEHLLRLVRRLGPGARVRVLP
jgi:L,D-peptidoglycan transpeptidase YkuD (ErfK/YbiS/YcfS/YnhG family)